MMLQCAIYVSLVGVLALGSPKTEAPAKNAVLLTLPKLDWTLEVGGTDLIVEQKEISPDGRNARFLAVDWTSGILVSGFLEDRGKPATAEECRDFYFAKLKDTPPKEENIVQSKLGDMAVAEYIVKEYAGIKMDQKHVNVYLAKGNIWMDVHLSKMSFQEGQRGLFNAIVRNVKLAPKTSVPKVRVSYRTTNQMVLRLDVPTDWSDEIKPGSGQTPPEIRMTPPPDGSSKVLITALTYKQDLPDDKRLPGIRRMVEDAGKEALPQAVEKTYDIRQFQGKSSAGYLFTLTDKAPKPNEFKYLTQGGYGVGRLILLFTVLSNEKDSDVLRRSLEMVGNMQAVTDRPSRTPAP
jgi:hypothetical protein